MSDPKHGSGADENRDQSADPIEPPGDERAPRYLQLLAIPIIVLLVLAIIGLIFYLRYSAANPPAGTQEEISGQAALSPGAVMQQAQGLQTQGPRAPVFEGRAMTGQHVTFPSGFSGKLVMLDFWATWCRPCVDELPNVVETYKAFQPRGLEIVGLPLDAHYNIPQTAVSRVIESKKIPWPQIYENAWSIAQQFQVEGIPAAFLVDGDTGRLLASGQALRGPSLRPTIEKCLDQKKGKSP